MGCAYFAFWKNICYNSVMSEKELICVLEENKKMFGQFASMLTEYNKKCNLTSITDEKGITFKHFYDSIAAMDYISDSANVVEIGSGGGFPSIPLKIARRDLHFTLIESTAKKCTFLRSVVENLSLDCVKVINTRAEEGAHDKFLRENFDFAVARAVARLNILCEYCLPFVRIGGKFIAYKGECDDELKEAKNAIKVLGGQLEEKIEYSLPEELGKRTLVIIKKIKPTPAIYPRGQGKERKKPL